MAILRRSKPVIPLLTLTKETISLDGFTAEYSLESIPTENSYDYYQMFIEIHLHGRHMSTVGCPIYFTYDDVRGYDTDEIRALTRGIEETIRAHVSSHPRDFTDYPKQKVIVQGGILADRIIYNLLEILYRHRSGCPPLKVKSPDITENVQNNR